MHHTLEGHPAFKTLKQEVNTSRTWKKCGTVSNCHSHHLRCCCCWGCWAELDPLEQKHCERSGVTASVSVSASSTWTTRSSHPHASSTEGQTAGHWVTGFSTEGATLMWWMECMFRDTSAKQRFLQVHYIICTRIAMIHIFEINVTSGFLPHYLNIPEER